MESVTGMEGSIAFRPGEAAGGQVAEVIAPEPSVIRLWGGHPAIVALRSFILFFLVWWAAAAWIGSAIKLPTPIAVFEALWGLGADGELFTNSAVSFVRLLISLAVAGALALPLGFLMGMSERVNAYIDPTVEMLRPISGIAWIPLGLFIFGVGDALPVFIMTYVAFFPMLLNTIAGVRGTDRKLVAAARTMGVSQMRIVRRVVLPGALPTIMVGIRIAFAGAWAAIIAAELIGAPSGLGFAIEWYRELLMSPEVFAYIVAIAAVGYACDLALQFLQRRMTPWMRGTELA